MKQFPALLSIAVSVLLASDNHGAEDLKPDSQGCIRHWLMLAPIVFSEGRVGADLIFDNQIRDEAALQPRAGDKITINGKELTWTAINASTNYFDLNATLRSVNDRAMVSSRFSTSRATGREPLSFIMWQSAALPLAA